MTIHQTVTITGDRFLSLRLPKTVPEGEAGIQLIVTPLLGKPQKTEAAGHTQLNPPLSLQEAGRILARKDTTDDSSRRFAGCLKGKGIFNGDPITIQRKMRDEWE